MILDNRYTCTICGIKSKVGKGFSYKNKHYCGWCLAQIKEAWE